MKQRTIKKLFRLISTYVVVASLWTCLQAAASRSRSEILKYADSGVGSPYVWGGSKWSATNKNIWGADCSGFAQKAWGYPLDLDTEQAIPGKYRLDTSRFIKAQDGGYPWRRMPTLSDAQPADAMVYRGQSSGHIFLVSDTNDSGVITLEARGRKYGIGYSKKSYSYLKNKGYAALRRTKGT